MIATADNSKDEDDVVSPSEETLESDASRMTDWANPPKLTDLKQHLENSRTIHNVHRDKVVNWLENFHVEGAAQVKSANGNSKIQPKLIRKQAEWRYPALSEPFLSSPDIFKVEPVSWEDVKAAQQNELVLNHQFNNQLDKVGFIDEYVRTAVDEGTVVVKVGWEYQTEDYEAQQPVVNFQFDPSYAPVLQHLDLMQHTKPDEYQNVPDATKQAHQYSVQNQMPYRPIDGGTEQVSKTRIVKNQPTLEVCDFRNVIIDPTAKGRIEDAKFVIYSWETSLSDLKKDGRYKNLDQVMVSSNGPLQEIDHTAESYEVASSGFNFNDKPRTKIVVYEYWGYWDIDGNGEVKPIVCAWIGNVIIRMEENPYPDKALPFVLSKYLPVRRTNYGEPDGALLEDNQKVVGALMRGMIDLMAKSANSQTGRRKDFLDSTNKRKFEQGMDYEFNPSVRPEEAVYMHKYPEIPQSAMMMLQLQQQEAESMTGVRSFAQGVSGNSLGDVAAGVRGALDAASKRELGILRRLAKGIVEVGRKIIAMNAEFLSEQEVVRLTNEQFVTVKRDDLPGNFDLKLSISTAEEDDNKARELAFMLQTIGPNDDPGIRQIILADICRLRKMPDLAHKLENYQPQPDPMAQQMQQLQMQLVQSEIMLNQAQAQSYGANAQLHAAKAGTEGVKQGHLQADTDQKNLDFVEQESGVKQERDLQKQSQAAQQQAALAQQAHAHKVAQTAVQQHQDAHHSAGLAVLQHHLDKKLPTSSK